MTNQNADADDGKIARGDPAHGWDVIGQPGKAGAFVHERNVGFAHDHQVDGVQTDLGKNTGKNRRNFADRIERSQSLRRPESQRSAQPVRSDTGLTPIKMRAELMAAPVAKEPSTVRSAKSSRRKVIYTPRAMMPQRIPCPIAPSRENRSAIPIPQR